MAPTPVDASPPKPDSPLYMPADLLLPRGVIGDATFRVCKVLDPVDSDVVAPRVHIQSLLCYVDIDGCVVNGSDPELLVVKQFKDGPVREFQFPLSSPSLCFFFASP